MEDGEEEEAPVSSVPFPLAERYRRDVRLGAGSCSEVHL